LANRNVALRGEFDAAGSQGETNGEEESAKVMEIEDRWVNG